MVLLHVGLDDTDSARGGCTTYIGALLVERLAKAVEFIDYPLLVRLNPNIPWKTRGNGAVCLRMEMSPNMVRTVKGEVISTVEEHAEMGQPRTDPGIVFLQGSVPPEAATFAEECIRDIVSKADAMRIATQIHAEAVGYGSGRGIIGALASVGSLLAGDHTYEFLAYRKPENRGTPRRVDPASIFTMDEQTHGRTFSNVDWERRRVLITPRGPDPILLGIRGETAEDVGKAFSQITVQEEVERWMVFRTNQGTDMHLPSDQEVATVRPRRPATVCGTVTDSPKSTRGGHVFFHLGTEGENMCCAAYEPSGSLRDTVRKLGLGDYLRVSGGVRPSRGRSPLTLNLERLEILSLTHKVALSNPLCPICSKHMKSMGRNKGYRCKRCGLRETGAEQVVSTLPRELDTGLYLPPPRAQRHLTKPRSRYGRERIWVPLAVEQFWGLGQVLPKPTTSLRASTLSIVVDDCE